MLTLTDSVYHYTYESGFPFPAKLPKEPKKWLPMRIDVTEDGTTHVMTPMGCGTARCKPTDKFDLYDGIEICLKRIERSYKKAYGSR